MAATDHSETGEPSRDDRERSFDPDAIVSVLDDDIALELFRTLETPTSVPALAAACDRPLSTTYRKVDALEAAGLIATATSEDARPTRYERAVDGVRVTLRDDVSVACIRGDDD